VAAGQARESSIAAACKLGSDASTLGAGANATQLPIIRIRILRIVGRQKAKGND
jgi:hypothetical protein